MKLDRKELRKMILQEFRSILSEEENKSDAFKKAKELVDKKPNERAMGKSKFKNINQIVRKKNVAAMKARAALQKANPDKKDLSIQNIGTFHDNPPEGFVYVVVEFVQKDSELDLEMRAATGDKEALEKLKNLKKKTSATKKEVNESLSRGSLYRKHYHGRY